MIPQNLKLYVKKGNNNGNPNLLLLLTMELDTNNVDINDGEVRYNQTSYQ